MLVARLTLRAASRSLSFCPCSAADIRRIVTTNISKRQTSSPKIDIIGNHSYDSRVTNYGSKNRTKRCSESKRGTGEAFKTARYEMPFLRVRFRMEVLASSAPSRWMDSGIPRLMSAVRPFKELDCCCFC
ncbi:hypothetical protein B296_00039166 [Ensete ventricosum]|uniref:Uncharacterized protein n=1 Tax=Ensete ventricosum TaxID=4639 RepID=A0A426YRL8_ENSVE|nr:hypothetical protein B296_00039166 [Ensete ventricosum]